MLHTLDNAEANLEKSILDRRFFSYNYWELVKMNLFLVCCKCCKNYREEHSEKFSQRLKNYRKWETAKEILASELDVEYFVRRARITKLISSVILSKP